MAYSSFRFSIVRWLTPNINTMTVKVKLFSVKEITWYKSRHSGEQIAHWPIQKKKQKQQQQLNLTFPLFFLSLSAILVSGRAVFVPRDR